MQCAREHCTNRSGNAEGLCMQDHRPRLTSRVPERGGTLTTQRAQRSIPVQNGWPRFQGYQTSTEVYIYVYTYNDRALPGTSCQSSPCVGSVNWQWTGEVYVQVHSV